MDYTMKDGTVYSIVPCPKDRWDDATELAFKVFLKFEAKEYGREGTDSFAEFLTNTSLLKLFRAGKYVVYVAMIGDEIIGISSVRSGNHLSLLFVDERYHRQGIGGQLIKAIQNYLLENTQYQTMTVNASPYGVPFYLNAGFKATGEETVLDGIIYTPMELYL